MVRVAALISLLLLTAAASADAQRIGPSTRTSAARPKVEYLPKSAQRAHQARIIPVARREAAREAAARQVALIGATGQHRLKIPKYRWTIEYGPGDGLRYRTFTLIGRATNSPVMGFSGTVPLTTGGPASIFRDHSVR